MRKIFVFTEREFPKIYRQLPKIVEDFRQLSKIAEDFVTTSEDN